MYIRKRVCCTRNYQFSFFFIFFYFLLFFLCHTAKKCYLCRVINEIYLCLGLSNGIFLCCLPLWLSFVIWQWLTMWGTWVRCLLSSEIVDCTDKPSSLHVYRIAHVGEYLLRPFFILIITYQTNHFFAVWIDENSSVSGRQERWFSLTVTSLD